MLAVINRFDSTNIR